MSNVSVQLSVRGRPSAFDLSPSNDIVVVASPGCMTFFHLNGLGVPRHVIHYEQPQQIRKVKYQKEGKLATLRGGIVSFWDPFHSLRPLLGLVQSSGWITDLEWSPNNNNMIATVCDQGDVRIFDLRTSSASLQNLSIGGSCSSVSWCSSDPNLIAACNHDGFNVWDTRMLVPSTNDQSSILWSHKTSRNTPRSSTFVNQVTWAHSETPCLITASTSSHLTWWDGLTGTKLGDGGKKVDSKDTSPTQTTPLPADPLPISCTLLSMPSGRGILTANRVAAEQHREPVDGPATIPRPLSSEFPSHFLLDKDSENKPDTHGEYVTSKIQTLVDVTDEIDNPDLLSTPIWINSFPRKEYSLTTLFEPPSVDQKDSQQLISARDQIALCREPILGMRWCPPGRLLPPSQGGLELILLSSVTSSLHALSLSPEIVDRYTTESASGVRGKHDSMKLSHRTSTSLESSYKMNPPKFSLSSLKRSLMTPKQLDNDSEQRMDGHGHEALNKTSATGSTFYAQLQHEILLLEEALQSDTLSGLSISRIDQYARQITLEMLKPVLSSEVEQKRRTSSASRGSRRSGSEEEDDDDDAFLDEDEDENDISDDDESISVSPQDRVSDAGESSGGSCVLIVSFVHSSPSFTVRSLYDTKTSENLSANSALESELESVFRSSCVAAQNQSATLTNSRDSRHPLPPSTGFLLDVARFFRNRALQVWGGIPTFHGVPLVLKSMNSLDNNNQDPDNDLNLSTDLGTGPKLLSTSSSKNQPAVIDPLSYRVPCPRSSGGIFSTTGHISCFGGSRLFLRSMQLPEHVGDNTDPPSQSRESSHDIKASYDDSSSLPATPVIPHSRHSRSAQHVLPPAQSQLSSPPQSQTQRSTSVIYPKTYGDLLVFQRDSKLTRQSKNKHSLSVSGDSENEKLNQHDMIQMPIKTTERYYGHFFLLQARKDLADGIDSSSSDSESPNLTDDDSTMTAESSDHAEGNAEEGSHRQPVSDDAGSDHSTNDLLSAMADPPSPNHSLAKRKATKKSSAMKDSLENTPALSSPYCSPKEVSIFRVLGSMTRRLAKEYLFAVNSNTRNYASSFSVPDPHFYRHVSGLSDPNLNSMAAVAAANSSNPHNIPRSGSLNNLVSAYGGYNESKNQRSDLPLSPNPALYPSLLPPLPTHGTRRSFSTIDLTMATNHLPPPSPKRDYFHTTNTPLSSSAPPSSSSSASASFYLRSGYEIAHSCRFNAQLTQSLHLSSLYHIWTMLAVCFEMLSLAGMEYHPSASVLPTLTSDESTFPPHAPKKKIESCRRMVISGLSYDWSRHALGRPLLRKIFFSLSHIGDLQTLSTITCTLGGARATAYYLDQAELYTAQSLDRMLLRYADILHRWQCHVEATEVSKYIADSDNSSRALGVEELSNYDLVSMKLEMQCVFCKKFIRNGNGQWCKGCKQFTQKCGVCEQIVRGFAFFCALCGHGGHPSHLKRWFEENVECPSGCGCRCGENLNGSSLQDSPSITIPSFSSSVSASQQLTRTLSSNEPNLASSQRAVT